MLKLFLYYLLAEQASSYYFYNTDYNSFLSSDVLNVPKGYRIIQPPKIFSYKKDKFTRGLYCKDMGFTCSKPFSYSSTYQFECLDDSNCPAAYICCPQRCFLHKVCTEGKTRRPAAPKEPASAYKCAEWPYVCRKKFPLRVTKKFRCIHDYQCPEGLMCCPQRCFSHKVCSRTVIAGDLRETTTFVESTTFMETTTTPAPTEVVTVTVKEDPVTLVESDEQERRMENYIKRNEEMSTNSPVETETFDSNAIDPNYKEYYDEESDSEEKRDSDEKQDEEVDTDGNLRLYLLEVNDVKK